MRWSTVLAALAVAMGLAVEPVSAQQLTVWHNLGDNGGKWFKAVAAEFSKSHPGVTLRATSYPTDQWVGRVIGALNTDTAPDLIFNN